MLIDELNNILSLYYNNSSSFNLIQSYINELVSIFKKKSLKNFKQKDIEKYLNTLKIKGNKNTTINAKLSFISKCLKYYKNPLIIPFQKINPTEKEIILKDDFKDLLLKIANSNNLFMYDIIQFLQIAYYTGLRANEILSIKKRHIKQIDETYYLKLLNTKNHQDNLIPLHKDLNPVIDNFKAFEINYKQLYYELKKYNITPHQFRHTFITNCFESGLNSFTVMRLVNHTSLNSTKKYIHLQNKFINQELERVNL